LRNLGRYTVPAQNVMVQITGTPIDGDPADALTVTKRPEFAVEANPFMDSYAYPAVELRPNLQGKTITWTATLLDPNDDTPDNNSTSITIEPCA
jgi:hypothetical protein